MPTYAAVNTKSLLIHLDRHTVAQRPLETGRFRGNAVDPRPDLRDHIVPALLVTVE